jgi:hypothetical protein
MELLGFKYVVTRQISVMKVRIYTVSFKLIRVIDVNTDGNYGKCTATVSGEYFQGLASGIYYYYMEAEDTAGSRKKSKISTIVLIN